MTNTYDVYGIGNALVDTLSHVDDDFISEHELNRGTMTLTDSHAQGLLLSALGNQEVRLQSGGSAANTMFGVALCGGSAFYCGKVAHDANGEFYREDLLKNGIHFDVHPAAQGSTGTCIVLTTPDAERTMYTNLGVSVELSPSDIDEDRLSRSKHLYLEGYLWDAPEPRAAFGTAAQFAAKSNVVTTMTFSDPFCVERYRDDFLNFAREHCDIVFCNRDEALRFAGVEDLEVAARTLGGIVRMAFVTNSAEGAIVAREGELVSVPGFPVRPVDTTGAGDAFAAGVLFALSHGYSPEQAARWGNYMASRTILATGARLQENLRVAAREVLV